MTRHLLFITLLLLAATRLLSQDLHMTYYQANSPFFNPANSGNFKGFLKGGGSFRSQYERTYQQGLFHADVNFHSPFHQSHWWSTGIQVLYDMAGRLQTGQTGGGMQVAYHIPLDKKSRHIISAGIQGASYHLSVNTKEFSSENTLKGVTDPDLAALNQFNASVMTLGIGAGYKRNISKKAEFSMGVALMNINKPSYRIIQDTTSFGRRFNVHAGYSMQLNKQFLFNPAFYYSQTERYSNVNVQCITEYKLTSKHNWAILGGLSHRIGESVALITGYKSKKTMACLSVDILAGATANTIANPGAIEVSAYHIFDRYTKPEVKPIVLCPRL